MRFFTIKNPKSIFWKVDYTFPIILFLLHFEATHFVLICQFSVYDNDASMRMLPQGIGPGTASDSYYCVSRYDYQIRHPGAIRKLMHTLPLVGLIILVPTIINACLYSQTDISEILSFTISKLKVFIIKATVMKNSYLNCFSRNNEKIRLILLLKSRSEDYKVLSKCRQSNGRRLQV